MKRYKAFLSGMTDFSHNLNNYNYYLTGKLKIVKSALYITH